MQNNYPQKVGIEPILRQAFSYWNKTLLFQLVFSLIFLSVFFSVYYYFSAKLGILDQYIAIFGKKSNDIVQMQKEVQKMAATPQYSQFSWIILTTMVLLYPLNIGFFKIYKKMDLGEKIDFEDLFSGYIGINFFIYTSYFLFWMMVFSYTLPTIILGIVWVFITLFSTPLMFFLDKRIFETIGLNFKALKSNFIKIFVGVFIAFFFKALGIFTIFGVLFTLPFSNAMIYSLYKNIFVEKN